MSLQRYDIPFVGVATRYSEICVLYNIHRKNKLFSGTAFNTVTGFSTPFLDLDYRLKYRHLMRVYFLPDGSACGFESVNHPEWRVYEGRRTDADKKYMMMTGPLPKESYYHQDSTGKYFNSPIGTIRMNPCVHRRNNSEKVLVCLLPRPERYQGKDIFWKVITFLDDDEPLSTTPSNPNNRLHKQLARVKKLLDFGKPIFSYIKSQAKDMSDKYYEDLGIFVQNCDDLLYEMDFEGSPEEIEELIRDSFHTQDLGVKLLEYLLNNRSKSLYPYDTEHYDKYIKMRKENAEEWDKFVRYG